MKIYSPIFLALVLFSCADQAQQESESTLLDAGPTFEIAPPVAEYEPAAEVFSIDNSKDTVLISDHGSFISIPANCFTDDNGNEISDVEVSFCEYSNPADILFSGIPMEYLDEGESQVFQSAGMCKIDASSKGSPVEIKKDKSIDIGLKNQAQDADYNLYLFDEVEGEWIEEQKNVTVNDAPLPLKPLTSSLIDSSRIVHVDVNNSLLSKTYQMWDNSNFYLLPGQDPKYGDNRVFWYDMRVIATTSPDVYILKFIGTKGNKQVIETMKVQPLVAEGDYDGAMELFESRMREHAKLLVKGKKKGKTELLSADETIAMLEKEHQDYQDELAAYNEELRIKDSTLTADRELAGQTYDDVIRTFKINKLGLYNCDRFYVREILATIKLNFVHEGDDLAFNYANLCSPSDNAVLTYVQGYDGTYSIDVSSGNFFFVGIKGTELYCAQVNAQTPDGDCKIEPITKTALEDLMN